MPLLLHLYQAVHISAYYIVLKIIREKNLL